MRTQSDLLDAFEKAQARREAPDFFQNLRIYEALYEEARSLGIFPLKDPLDGIESDLHLARRLNVQTAPRKTGESAG
ncbi:hypothetical protein [Rhodocaloribacter sp.]